ncbi:Rho GTPase-activating protein 7 [Dissostichus eleginoides]|uniref:Rho GTPase-activating protein 7 n=1 Tax=Dissostichus eleginoides TaxID=100907 RepID=A0AAD9BF40_DISEL|nr:Rho GTPase-activating protein 7 [Dissostichus eleginoides]
MDHSYMAAMEEMDTLSDSSSIGEAVSGRGRRRRESDEDDGIFYIPERRRSLHLDQTPMDTSHWQYVEQAFSPALSYGSMTSEENLSNMDGEEGSPTRLQLRRADSYSSYNSQGKNKDETATEVSDTPVLKHNPNEFKHPALTVEFTFKAICEILRELSEDHLLFFKVMLWKRYPQSFNTPPQSLDLVDLVDRLLECYNLEVSLQITKTLLESIKERRLVKCLQSLCLRNEVRYELCKTLKKTYGEIDDDSAVQGERGPLTISSLNWT